LAKEGKQEGWKDRRKTENKLTVLVNLFKLYLSAYGVLIGIKREGIGNTYKDLRALSLRIWY